MASAPPPTAPPMMASFVLDEVDKVVFPGLVDIAEVAPTLMICVPLVAVGMDAEGETWFGQTVKVLLLFAACCSTAKSAVHLLRRREEWAAASFDL